MANLKDKIVIDIENLDRVFAEMPKYELLHQLTPLELAGVATLLHNFYGGTENIIKRILIEKNITIPQGISWHKELLILALEEKIITDQIKEKLGEFLAFRHFINHGYAIDLSAERLAPLVKVAFGLYQDFKNKISKRY